jgi:hypothetical protein
MVLYTFFFASLLGLVLGGSSRYLGFGWNWARSLHPVSRGLVIVLIVRWVAAPFLDLLGIGCFLQALQLDDLPFDSAILQSIGIALGLLQGCIAFAIGWLAGPEADIPYRPRNPFQEDVPPVFLFQPNKEGDSNWLDVPLDKPEAA